MTDTPSIDIDKFWSDVEEMTNRSHEKTVAKIDEFKHTVAEGMDDDTRDLVAYTYQFYTEWSRLPSAEELTRATAVGHKRVLEIIAGEPYKKAIANRGVTPDSFHGLNAEQMYLIQILTNPTDKRDLTKKLRAAGVSYSQYRAWQRNPAFSSYMGKITEGLLNDHLPDFLTALSTKALGGDLNSIKYALELSGRHDPQAQQVQDLRVIVYGLLEIIQRNVTDPQVFKNIANEAEVLLSGATIKGELGS